MATLKAMYKVNREMKWMTMTLGTLFMFNLICTTFNFVAMFN